MFGAAAFLWNAAVFLQLASSGVGFTLGDLIPWLPVPYPLMGAVVTVSHETLRVTRREGSRGKKSRA